jgi:hypothetical protein
MAMAKQQQVLLDQQINRLMEKPKRKGVFGDKQEVHQEGSQALVVQHNSHSGVGTPQRKFLN